MWRYAELPAVFGGAPDRYHAATAATADALAPAMRAAAEAQAAGKLAWLEVVTPKLDVPAAAAWMHGGRFKDGNGGAK